MKQLRIYHARHQPSLSFPGAVNVGHEPSRSGSTLDGFGSRDLRIFAEAKPSIQLHTQIPNALFPLEYNFLLDNVFDTKVFSKFHRKIPCFIEI